MARSARRSSRLLQRGGTIAATATALVLGGSGLALGATTHDVTTTPASNTVTTTVTTVTGLAPTPRAQDGPAPALPAPLGSVVKPVVKTVTGAVGTLTGVPSTPPVPGAPGAPKTKTKGASAGKPAIVRNAATRRTAQRVAPQAVSKPRLPIREDAATLKPMQSLTLRAQHEAAVMPQLAPATTVGPLADLPDAARHVLPVAFVVAAAAILACLAAGHLGLWYERRNAQV